MSERPIAKLDVLVVLDPCHPGAGTFRSPHSCSSNYEKIHATKASDKIEFRASKITFTQKCLASTFDIRSRYLNKLATDIEEVLVNMQRLRTAGSSGHELICGGERLSLTFQEMVGVGTDSATTVAIS